MACELPTEIQSIQIINNVTSFLDGTGQKLWNDFCAFRDSLSETEQGELNKVLVEEVNKELAKLPDHVELYQDLCAIYALDPDIEFVTLVMEEGYSEEEAKCLLEGIKMFKSSVNRIVSREEFTR